MLNESPPLQKAGFIRKTAGGGLDLLIILSLGFSLLALFGFFIRMDDPRFMRIIFPSVLPCFLGFIALYALLDRSPGFFVLKIRLLNSGSLTKPTLKQKVAFSTGLFTDSNTERISAVIDRDNKTPALLRIALAVIVIGPLFLLLFVLSGLASKHTLLYEKSISFINANRVGESKYGSPIRLGFVPRTVVMNNNKGRVVVSARWPNYSGFIAIDLNRENGDWEIDKIDILDSHSPIERSFRYHLTRTGQAKPLKEAFPELLFFLVSWLAGLAILIYLLYILIKIRRLRDKTSIPDLAVLKRKAFFLIILVLGLTIVEVFLLQFFQELKYFSHRNYRQVTLADQSQPCYP